MKLTWHKYKYFPYERQLAFREAVAVLGSGHIREVENGLEFAGNSPADEARRLVYFSQVHDGKIEIDTVQARLERAAASGKNRQATRYSVHGLHEYKGKFNPQVAKALLNIFGVHRGDKVLDPFCGSGTTLVEAAQAGVSGYGFDINPLAVYVANAKLQALVSDGNVLERILKDLVVRFTRTKNWAAKIQTTPRDDYLRSWFDQGVFGVIENVRQKITDCAGDYAPIFMTVASNLLREYSQQDPNDLRIRRRSSPLPALPYYEAFIAAARHFLDRLREAQVVLGQDLPIGKAILCDITQLTATSPLQLFDAALTSPPYAMALPYIDTQRLSLVWLDLVPPGGILGLEADLIGSREMKGAAKRELQLHLSDNPDGLPSEQLDFCLTMKTQLSATDGFRRQAVPYLLYRYFSGMKESFAAVRTRLRHGAPYALIVGHNHTILGGKRCDINTPAHLAALAESVGWSVEEIVELQTYQRFGYHAANAVSSESLILLRNR